jgi:hypothetical protein
VAAAAAKWAAADTVEVVAEVAAAAAGAKG